MSQPLLTPEPVMSRKSGALQGTISVPGDKSISHRALILGAMAQGQTEISGLLESGDIMCTLRALQALGVTIERDQEQWRVTGVGLGGLLPPDNALDFGNSGTGARLMMGVIAGHPLSAVFTGDASLMKRPMGRVLDPLKTMGLEVVEEGRSTLPLTLNGTADLVPIVYKLPVPSAQVKSAVLLAGLLAAGRTSVVESESTRDHTEKMLTYFGGDVSVEPVEGGTRISVEGQHDLKGKPVIVPGDPSSAAFLAAAALLCPGSDVLIGNVLTNPTRTGFYTTLAEMGADLSLENKRELNGEMVADIRVRTSSLKGVHVPASRAPTMIDEYPCLAVLAAFASGDTIMDGLAELRVKESDRLAAMVDGLKACGVVAEATGNTLRVMGARTVPGGATITTHMDHRIAMSFLVMGLASERPVTVDDTSMIATSFPRFVEMLRGLGADIGKPDLSLSTKLEDARQ